MFHGPSAFTGVTHEFTTDMSLGEPDRKRTPWTDLELVTFRHGWVVNLLLGLMANGDERSAFLFMVLETLRTLKFAVAVFAVHPFTYFAVGFAAAFASICTLVKCTVVVCLLTFFAEVISAKHSGERGDDIVVIVMIQEHDLVRSFRSFVQNSTKCVD